jgi:hypothetical protein
VLFPTTSITQKSGAVKSNAGMCEAYHFIGGEALQKIGTYVDGAPSGEVCVSQKVLDMTASAKRTFTSKVVEGTILFPYYRPIKSRCRGDVEHQRCQ